MSYLARQLPSARRRLMILTIAGAVVLAACGGSEASRESSAESASTSPAASPIALVDPNAFSAALAASPEMPLINVHVPYENHIEGTDAFIPFDSILESPDLPADKAAPIALYCRSGNMSGQASVALADAGYTNVIDLDGGMNAWETSGNSLVDDPSAAK